MKYEGFYLRYMDINIIFFQTLYMDTYVRTYVMEWNKKQCYVKIMKKLKDTLSPNSCDKPRTDQAYFSR